VSPVKFDRWQADVIDITTFDSSGRRRRRRYRSSAGAASWLDFSPMFSTGVHVLKRRLLGHLPAELTNSDGLPLSRWSITITHVRFTSPQAKQWFHVKMFFFILKIFKNVLVFYFNMESRLK